ncbi:MAG TPA: hypothetical protein VLD64_09150 [Nitrosarchaeum sp.]|nr:hypothetical protein [Nitrosarchaeum sp.]
MNIESERLGKNMPSIRSLIIISIGLIIVAILTSAFVYAETATVDVGGISHDIQYVGTGVTVSGITADTDFVSLVLSVDVSGTPGTLEITLDRSFFDSTFQGSDDNFIVLADGDEPKFSEIQTNSQSRTLSIELPAGTQEVEIIGSQFGSEPTTPVETPTTPVETPTEPTTPVETPTEPTTPTEKPTTPVETPTEQPKTECGPGTILKDGVCVLDERCGPGTTLKDGVCVAEPVTETASPKGLGTQLVMGIAISFVIAGIVGLVLALMSKASKSKK